MLTNGLPSVWINAVYPVLPRRVPSSLPVVDTVSPGFCYGSELPWEFDCITAIFVRIAGYPPSVGARTLVYAAVMQNGRYYGQYVEEGRTKTVSDFPIPLSPPGILRRVAGD